MATQGASGAGGEVNGCALGTAGDCGVCTSGAAGASGCTGPSCDACELPHATSKCVAGQCGIDECAEGFRDANGNDADGCEAGDLPSAGLSLWLMGDQGLTTAGVQISQWMDQSGSGIAATQTDASAMPTRVETANGPPLVEFDGVDDHLALPPDSAESAGLSFFAVAEALEAEGCAGLLHFSNGRGADDIEFGRHTPNLLYYEVLGEFLEGTANGFPAGQRLLVSVIQDPGGLTELRLNTALDARGTINVPLMVERSQNFVGKDIYAECPSSFHGRLGELVYYKRWIDASERKRIEQYLLTKWSITPVIDPD